MSARLFLEDLHQGQRFAAGPYDVTEAAIKAFAAEFDPQIFHLDAEAAKSTPFRGLAASGWHTAAITMRLMVDGGMPVGNGVVGLGGEISWPKPVRPGDRLRIESEIIDITPSRSKPDQAILTVRTLTFNQSGAVVQILTAKIVAYRRNRASF
jgi:acyl dehydratase